MSEGWKAELDRRQDPIFDATCRKRINIASDGHRRDDDIIRHRKHTQFRAFHTEIRLRQAGSDVAAEEVAPSTPFSPLPVHFGGQVRPHKQPLSRQISGKCRSGRPDQIPEGERDGTITPWVIADMAKACANGRGPLDPRDMLAEGKGQAAERVAKNPKWPVRRNLRQSTLRRALVLDGPIGEGGIPCLRHRSAHFAPASCSCKMPMICSSVSRAFFIVRPLHRPDSNRRWRKNPVAGHWRHRLALIEAADLSWFVGDRIGPDRLALWMALRMSGVQDDAAALARVGWAVRRLTGGPGPEEDLAAFVDRRDPENLADESEPFADRAGG